MLRRNFLGLGLILPAVVACGGGGGGGQASVNDGPFSLSRYRNSFLLHGNDFQIRSGEMHPSRIPIEYWQHRIQMAKAMGMNTISLYVMWNYHETAPGSFDFTTGNRDISAFIRLCQSEGMWVILRPGPYVCGEWDFGGLPAYLLADYPHHEALRRNAGRSPAYMAAARRYLSALAEVVKPLMIENGGPILMLQIENEFSSWNDGPDAQYLAELSDHWRQHGFSGPFCYEDGFWQTLSATGTRIPKQSAFGISDGDAAQIAQAREAYPDSVSYAGEIWTGWITHWGDAAMAAAPDHSKRLADLMAGKHSFNLYVIHGGTNFGFTAGANADPKGNAYQPQVTSYDYGAPISEHGRATPLYTAYRNTLARYLGGLDALPPVPVDLPSLRRAADFTLQPIRHSSLWEDAPVAIPAAQPKTFESIGLNGGLLRYRCSLPTDPRGGALLIDALHDYATVYVNGTHIGTISRVSLPADRASVRPVVAPGAALLVPANLSGGDSSFVLDIVVEAMGHINFYTGMNSDAKGILGKVVLQSGQQTLELGNWAMYAYPLEASAVSALARQTAASEIAGGHFFKVSFTLDNTGDVYVDLSAWAKGMVWVNGHALGRYWDQGPQTRLFCPGVWLRIGENELIVLDLHRASAAQIRFQDSLS
jgi:beta-galactosidase